MERIVIRETDNTVTSVLSEDTNVVYVPGFSIADYSVGSLGAQPHVPTLCTSIREFENYFGDVAPTFLANQSYPFHTDSGSTTYSFPDYAMLPDTSGELDFDYMFKFGDADPSYIYAKELLYRGVHVIYERLNEGVTSSDISVNNFYDQAISALSFESETPETCKLLDKGIYRLKYITSGGYPSFEYTDIDVVDGSVVFSVNALAKAMLALASKRGDCYALIDHTYNPYRALTGSESVFSSINSTDYKISSNNLFGAMFTNHIGHYTHEGYAGVNTSYYFMPGSFSYLDAISANINSGTSTWLAVAGVSRGRFSGSVVVDKTAEISNAVADSYQISLDNVVSLSTSPGISINPITYVYPYGYCIRGNRTLQDYHSSASVTYAGNFLNTRNALCDIKKELYNAANALMFEQNTDVLWINFKSMVAPTLEKMKSSYIISDYKFIKTESSNHSKLTANIRIYPIYSVEAFEINIEITDTDATVS